MKDLKYSINNSERVQWEGLTLDELRYARAINKTRIDITKQIIGMQGRQIYDGQFAGTGSRSMLGRMFSALNYLDYGLIAMRFGGRFLKWFRRR